MYTTRVCDLDSVQTGKETTGRYHHHHHTTTQQFSFRPYLLGAILRTSVLSDHQRLVEVNARIHRHVVNSGTRTLLLELIAEFLHRSQILASHAARVDHHEMKRLLEIAAVDKVGDEFCEGVLVERCHAVMVAARLVEEQRL